MINFGNGGGGDGDGAVEQVDGPGLPPPQIPRPALVLLIGPSGSG
jgi:hypothetical protein